MYSVVLMMALTTGTDSVDFCHGNRGHCSGGSYGCYGGGYRGCYGGYGGCYGGYGRYGCSGGGYGCYGGGGYGCYGGGGCGGMIIAPSGGGMQPEPLRTPPKKTTSVTAPATILVTLPPSAKLTIDGSPTTSTSGTRTFVSPPLARGSSYIYTLRAEVNGQTQSQDIRVTPGEITQAQFTFPTAAVSAPVTDR